MIFTVLQKAANKIKGRLRNFLEALASTSMQVFLLHQQIIYLFILWLNGLINPYFHVAVNFLGSLFLSVLIAKIVKRSKIGRIALGEKST